MVEHSIESHLAWKHSLIFRALIAPSLIKIYIRFYISSSLSLSLTLITIKKLFSPEKWQLAGKQLGLNVGARTWKMVISHQSPIYYNFYRPKINIKMRFQNKNLYFFSQHFMAYHKSSNRPIFFSFLFLSNFPLQWKKMKRASKYTKPSEIRNEIKFYDLPFPFNPSSWVSDCVPQCTLPTSKHPSPNEGRAEMQSGPCQDTTVLFMISFL